MSSSVPSLGMQGWSVPVTGLHLGHCWPRGQPGRLTETFPMTKTLSWPSEKKCLRRNAWVRFWCSMSRKVPPWWWCQSSNSNWALIHCGTPWLSREGTGPETRILWEESFYSGKRRTELLYRCGGVVGSGKSMSFGEGSCYQSNNRKSKGRQETHLATP